MARIKDFRKNVPMPDFSTRAKRIGGYSHGGKPKKYAKGGSALEMAVAGIIPSLVLDSLDTVGLTPYLRDRLGQPSDNSVGISPPSSEKEREMAIASSNGMKKGGKVKRMFNGGQFGRRPSPEDIATVMRSRPPSNPEAMRKMAAIAAMRDPTTSPSPRGRGPVLPPNIEASRGRVPMRGIRNMNEESPMMKKGGKIKMAKGGGVESRGKTRGKYC